MKQISEEEGNSKRRLISAVERCEGGQNSPPLISADP
jgi:hypothetical protein